MSDTEPAWLKAVQSLEELHRASEVLALLRALDDAGLSGALAAGAPAADLAGTAGTGAQRLSLVLEVLGAHGIASHDAGRWQLRPDWAGLVRGESPFAWDAQLAAGRVQAAGFERALGGARDYWSLAPAERLAMARAMSFDPSSPATVAMVRDTMTSVPGAVAALEGGGRFLELGCGVASRLTALLLAFPSATGVGVELTEDLAEFGYERAQSLGVGDRLEVHVVDATEYEPEGVFDGAQWSQFFFPEASRLGTLATARMALRPGAWLLAPVAWDGVPPAPGSEEDRELAHFRLLLDLWGVPTRSTSEVAAELEAAGFVNVAVEEQPGVHRVRGCQP